MPLANPAATCPGALPRRLVSHVATGFASPYGTGEGLIMLAGLLDRHLNRDTISPASLNTPFFLIFTSLGRCTALGASAVSGFLYRHTPLPLPSNLPHCGPKLGVWMDVWDHRTWRRLAQRMLNCFSRISSFPLSLLGIDLSLESWFLAGRAVKPWNEDTHIVSPGGSF